MYDLIWVAAFKGPIVLFQYDGQGVEIPFSKVLANQDNLVRFSLINRALGECYSVDLEEGTISITHNTEPFLDAREDMLRKGDIKYRLIYFREVTRNFDSQLKEVDNASINFFLGFQYTDNEGHNHKRLMRIHADGRLVIN